MKLQPCTLNATACAPFGEAIIQLAATAQSINHGTCIRYDDLARASVDAAGAVGISLFAAQPQPLPLALTMLERHPCGSQAFIPLGQSSCCIIVATGEDTPDLTTLTAFSVPAGQGFNLRRGIWHHPLVALKHAGNFLVVDRIGPGSNLEIFELAAGLTLVAA